MNDPCIFRHRKLKVVLASYVDDLLIKSDRATVDQVLKLVTDRFDCKPASFLTKGSPIDHLGMMFDLADDENVSLYA